jgi:betaine lipid synthase
MAFALAAVRGNVQKLCQATSVEEQETIWRRKLRPVLLNKVLMKGFLGNP